MALFTDFFTLLLGLWAAGLNPEDCNNVELKIKRKMSNTKLQNTKTHPIVHLRLGVEIQHCRMDGRMDA